MLLSVIIVNYKVKNLLRDCLKSVELAAQHMDTEIWVVDNHSNDGSVEMLQQEFPQVNVIANTDNKGFSVANNQAIDKAKGEYLLILNPDTRVNKNTFQDCLTFNQSTKNCGGIGVKMLNQKGNFLAESKRGYPSLWTAISRGLKLYKLFPKSAFFNPYYLGHLDQNSCHKVDVLAGAFIWIKRSIYKEVGGLDNDFFMYGEDIDLSYKIKKANYQNYYLGTTSILHYKGESTDMLSIDYISRFYGAMKIFTKKHKPFTYPLFHLAIGLMMIYKKALLYLRLILVKKA